MSEISETKPRVVLLYRASTKQQTDSDNDIPLQRNYLKPWIEQNGWTFIDEFCEGGVSGYKISANDRDAIQKIKLMADRRAFDILGIYMSDRLGRIAEETPLIVSYLNARGIRVVSYKEGEINSSSHADKLMTYIRYWQAEGESIKTSLRVCDAVLENVNKGRWRGGAPPYGYRSVSRGTLNYKGKPILDVEIDPVTGEHVKTVFDLYTKQNYGTRLVAKYLNDREILTPKGRLWNSSLVSKILRCKLYLGIYVLHKEVKNKPLIESPVMPHLVLVDEAVWYKAQMLLEKNSTGARRKPTRKGNLLLTGLLYCGQCGNKLISFYSYPATERDKPHEERTRRYYYRCCGHSRPKSSIPKCKPSMWSVDIMDETVIFHAKNFVLEMDRERLLADHENDVKTRIAEASKRLDRAENDRNKNEREIKKLKDEIMRALMGESTFSQNMLGEMLKTKEAEGAEIVQRYEDAQAAVFELEQELAMKKGFVEEFTDWDSRFDLASAGEKRSMLLNIIDRIIVDKDEIRVTFKAELLPLDGLTLAGAKPLTAQANPENTGMHDTTAANSNFLCPDAVKRYGHARLRQSSI